MQPGNNIVEYGKDVDKAIELSGKVARKISVWPKISELPKYVNDSVSKLHERVPDRNSRSYIGNNVICCHYGSLQWQVSRCQSQYLLPLAYCIL